MPDAIIVPEPTPMGLLQQAVTAGLDPERLEKLLNLQQRYEASQARKLYSEAMHACQTEIPQVGRDKKNTSSNSTYATLEKIQRIAKPVYSSHGFSLSYGEADCPVSEFKRTVCDVRHVGGHCERYHLDLPLDGIGAKGNAIGNMNRVQAAVSTTSYGQRRLLCMIFNITLSDEDDDAQCSAVITDEQATILQEWLSSTGTNLVGFLKWADADSLAKFPADKYEDAIAFFKRKEAKR